MGIPFGSFARAGIVAALTALVACSSGGATPNPPVSASSAGVAAGTASAHVRIVVPPRTAPAARARSPKYVSPATMSILVTVTPTGTTSGSPQTFAVNISPASPQCAGTATNSTVCTLTIGSLMPGGTYTVGFSAYDQPQSATFGAGSTPAGNALSANQGVPLTVVAGSANQIDVVLDGIPTGVAFVPAPSSSFSGTVAGGFRFPSCSGVEAPGAENANVVGTDADGNFIVGPGAPTISLVSSDATALTTAAAPAPAQHYGQFSFSGRARSAAAPLAVTLTATATTPSDGALSKTVTASLAVPVTLTPCNGLVTRADDQAAFLAGGSSGPGMGTIVRSGSYMPAGDLRYVLQNVPAGGTITFALPGCTTAGSAACVLTEASEMPVIGQDVTIDGGGLVALDGGGAGKNFNASGAISDNGHRLFFIESGNVGIRNVTIQNASDDAGTSDGFGGTACACGGAVFVDSTTAHVTLTNVAFSYPTLAARSSSTSKTAGGGGGLDSINVGLTGGGVFLAGGLGDGGAQGQPGGFGGGGGGSLTGDGGNGGFGGGGGGSESGSGGNGGFGAGGGGSPSAGVPGKGGYDAGDGFPGRLGGGGALLGFAVFVHLGTLTTSACTAVGYGANFVNGGFPDDSYVFDYGGTVNGLVASPADGPMPANNSVVSACGKPF